MANKTGHNYRKRGHSFKKKMATITGNALCRLTKILKNMKCEAIPNIYAFVHDLIKPVSSLEPP